MSTSLHKLFCNGLLACATLFATAALALADGDPVVRDHRGTGGPTVRDHRSSSDQSTGQSAPIVRDHRNGADPELIKTLTKAMNAVFRGPEVKKLKVNGHEFNVKPAQVSTFSGTLIIKGQISHCLTLRPDDQVYYTINKTGNQVKLVQFEIQLGGVRSIVDYPSKLVNDALGTSLGTPFDAALRDLGKAVDGEWESSADLMIAAICLQARYMDTPGGLTTTRRPTTTATTAMPSNTDTAPSASPSSPVVRNHR